MPATAQAMLAARIDRLAPEDKRLLQSAAVIGKDVPFALLQAIAELPEESLREGLAQLQAAEFLYETSLFPDLEYTFKHALTHEVAYGEPAPGTAPRPACPDRGGHRDALPDRLAEQIERLAHHALRGEVWEKADYLRQAGQKAAAGRRNRKLGSGSNRRLESSRCCRRARPRWSIGSRSASSCGRRLSSSERASERWTACAKPRPSPSDQ